MSNLKQLFMYILLLMMLLALLGVGWYAFDKQQTINDLTNIVMTAEAETNQLHFQIEQQAQKVATAEALVESQRSEMEEAKTSVDPGLLFWQGNTLAANHPLLGLRLLLEAWYLASPVERDAIEPAIRQLAYQGRLLTLSQEDIEQLKNRDTEPPPPSETPFLANGDFILTMDDKDGYTLHSADGEIVFTFLNVMDVRSQKTSFLVRFKDRCPEDCWMRQGELYYTKGDEVSILTGIKQVEFSPSGEYFVVEYPYELKDDYSGATLKSELRRVADNQLLMATDSRPMINENVYLFSPQERHLAIYAHYGSHKLYRVPDGEFLEEILEFDNFNFSPNDTYYLIINSKQGRPAEVHRDGQPIPIKTDSVLDISLPIGFVRAFSPDGKYFIIQDAFAPNYQLWYVDDVLVPLLDFDDSKAEYFFDPNQSHLIWYANDQGYLIDLDWLTAIHTNPSVDLMEVACLPFMRKNSFFDDAELTSYLNGQKSLACQEK